MKQLTTLLASILILPIGSAALAQVIPTPPAPNEIAPTPKPQMSKDTIVARRKFYITRYSTNKKEKLTGSLVQDFGPDNTTRDYASWLSSALRNHPHTRYFKIKADFGIAMHNWTDVWVYDRQFHQLRYLQRAWNFNPPKVSAYHIYQNVDDAAVRVLAEDNQPMSKITDYTPNRT